MVTEWLIIMKTEWSANEKIHLIIKNQKNKLPEKQQCSTTKWSKTMPRRSTKLTFEIEFKCPTEIKFAVWRIRQIRFIWKCWNEVQHSFIESMWCIEWFYSNVFHQLSCELNEQILPFIKFLDVQTAVIIVVLNHSNQTNWWGDSFNFSNCDSNAFSSSNVVGWSTTFECNWTEWTNFIRFWSTDRSTDKAIIYNNINLWWFLSEENESLERTAVEIR